MQCELLIPEQPRHGGVPGRQLSACSLVNNPPNDDVRFLPPAALLEKVLPGL
jgi:hypothetical protein